MTIQWWVTQNAMECWPISTVALIRSTPDFQDDSLANASAAYNTTSDSMRADRRRRAGATFVLTCLDQHGLEEPRNWRDVMEMAAAGLGADARFFADIFLNFSVIVSRGSPWLLALNNLSIARLAFIAWSSFVNLLI